MPCRGGPSGRAARPRRTVALLGFLLALAPLGCSKCGGKARKAHSVPMAVLLPRDADAVVLAPDFTRIGTALEQVQRLRWVGFVARLEGFPSASAWVDAWVRQLGVDPRSPKTLERVGIDPSRGFAVALFADPSGKDAVRSYAVVGLGDASRFRKALGVLAQRRLGAAKRVRVDVGALTLTTWSADGSSVPALGEIERDGFALLASGASVKGLVHWAQVVPGKALATEKGFIAAKAALASGPAPVAWVHLRKGSAWGDSRLAPGGLTAAVRISAKGLDLRAALPWPNPAEVHALEQVKSPDWTPSLPPSASLYVRAQVDPARWKGLWRKWLPSGLVSALERSGLKVEDGVLANLQPGAVLGAGLLPTARLSGGLSSFDFRRADPFQSISLFAEDGVKRTASARAVLEKLAENAGKFGARISAKAVGGQKVFVSSYALGEGLSFAVRDGKLFAVAPRTALLERLARKGSGPKTSSLPKDLRHALDAHAVTVAVDLGKLSRTLAALPDSAWGVGGFAIKMVATRWLGALDELKTASFGVSGKDGTLWAELRIRWSGT